jgi:hypothetical protein
VWSGWLADGPVREQVTAAGVQTIHPTQRWLIIYMTLGIQILNTSVILIQISFNLMKNLSIIF